MYARCKYGLYHTLEPEGDENIAVEGEAIDGDGFREDGDVEKRMNDN
jgi:hypothetical protein